MGSAHNHEFNDKVLSLWNSGQTTREIAEALGVRKDIITQCLHRLRKRGIDVAARRKAGESARPTAAGGGETSRWTLPSVIAGPEIQAGLPIPVPKSCCWPMWVGKAGPDPLYCGAPIARWRGSYCSEHERLSCGKSITTPLTMPGSDTQSATAEI